MKSISPEELQKLCDEHWGYIEQIIRNEYDSDMAQLTHTSFDLDAYYRRVELHYKTAMVHGFKHGIQWIEEQLKKEVP